MDGAYYIMYAYVIKTCPMTIELLQCISSHGNGCHFGAQFLYSDVHQNGRQMNLVTSDAHF